MFDAYEYTGLWYCEIHDEEYTSEGICPACYVEMQCGDAFASDKGGASDD